jgi:hypothetical protein
MSSSCHNAAQFVAWLRRKVRRVTPRVFRHRHLTRHHSRTWHDARIRESEEGIKGCMWPFGLHAGCDL